MLLRCIKTDLLISLIPVLALAPMVSFADGSPWLLAPGSTQFELTSIQQSADEFYIAGEKANLPDDLKLSTTQIAVQYGLRDDLLIDFRTGYSESDYSPPAGHPLGVSDNDLEGFSDTSIGLTWRIRDEFLSESSAPSVAIRIAATFDGDYDAFPINSIGDGAAGAEVSLLVGKIFNSGFAVLGDIGYRYRDNKVPNEWLLSLGGSYSIAPGLGINVFYQSIQSRGSLDISDAKFTGQFPETDEDKQILSVGISYNISNKVNIALNYGEYIDGRNTPDSEILSLSFGYHL